MQGSHRHGGGLTRIRGDGAAPSQTLLVSLLTRYWRTHFNKLAIHDYKMAQSDDWGDFTL